MSKLSGKVAIVTASTRGIGYSCVETLAKAGAKVYMACRNLELGAEKCKVLTEAGLDVQTVYFEAYDKESIVNMIDYVVEKEGRIDILVNNFGGTKPTNDFDIQNTNYEEFAKYVDVHLSTVFLASQHAINKAMSKQKSGSIINIGSVAGITPDTSQIAYGTSKAAIIHMTKVIAIHAAKDNITCNVVCPGMTATEAVKNNLTPAFQEFFLKHTPVRRMAEPQEIADAVLYFADAGFSTGQVVAVHGGFGGASPVYGDMLLMKNKR
jgi:NAD(P)-dependent dehydrogenase (short-subunit alcohol dehydrogenase family)